MDMGDQITISMLSRQFLPGQDWRYIQWAGQGAKGNLHCCCFDWICLVQERSQVQDSSLQPTPSPTSTKAEFIYWKENTQWFACSSLPVTEEKKLLHIFISSRNGLPGNSPDPSLCRWLLWTVLPVLNSWFVISLLSFTQSLTTSERFKMQLYHSANVQSPENASSPYY